MNILFEYPAAFAALGAIPVLLAIYLLRNRFRPYYVSGLMLWDVQRRHKQGGLNLDRLQTPLLLALELPVLTLLALAATGPLLRTGSEVRRMVVVLDDSFSMLAGQDEDYRKTALDELMLTLRQSEPFSVTLIRAGTQPVVIAADMTTLAEVSSALGQWSCTSVGADLDKAVALASEMADERARVLILSDHLPEGHRQGSRFEYRAVGRPLDNAGFIHAERTGDRCILVIANYSVQRRTVTLVIDALEGGRLYEQRVEILPSEPYRMIFESPAGSDIAAEIDADALAADNRVVLLSTPVRQVRTVLDLSEPRLSESVYRVLEALPAVRMGSGPADLLITDKSIASDAGAGLRPWILEFVAEPNAAAFVGPFIVDRNHPLTEGLDLQGVIWSAPSGYAMQSVPIVSAGNTGLLESRQDRSGTLHLRLFFNHNLSTLQQSTNWPVLFYNLVQWRQRSLPGIERANWRLGSQVRFEAPPDTRSLRILYPDGKRVSQDGPVGQVIVEAEQAGVYQVIADGNRQVFAVNALSADESDLRACQTVRRPAADQGQLFWWEYRRYDKLLLLAAAILLALHGVAVYAQSKGRA
jgi:hypothetical protein